MRQNLILVATKNIKISEIDNREFKVFKDKLWTKEIHKDVPTLTDDFAPVEKYTAVGL